MQGPDISVSSGGKMWNMGGLTKKQLARKTWHQIVEDEVLGRSAQLAYFFLFAIFPLAIFLTALVGVFAGPHSHLAHQLSAYLTRAMPASAGNMVRATIHHSLANSGGGKLTYGIVLALFFASSGMAAMIDALNVVFGVDEGRSPLRKRLTALGLTCAVGLLVCAAIFLIAFGGEVAGATIAGGFLYWAWQVVQYPLAFFFLLVSLSLVYHFAPNVQNARWRVFTPGSVAGLCLWVAVSFGLRGYLRNFNSYTSDYGTMGAFMVLMLWFYLTGLAFLVGGELDDVIRHAGIGKSQRADKQRPVAEKKQAPGHAA